jgi:hypothetical protein
MLAAYGENRFKLPKSPGESELRISCGRLNGCD